MARPSPARILIVEDDEPTRGLIREILTGAGYKIAQASNGEEALRKVKARPFDLMLLDIMMPGVDGYEVLERVRAMPGRADMAVIAVTAKGDPAGMLREAASGTVDHVTKPFSPEDLLLAVERALGAPGGELRAAREMRERSAATYGSVRELYERSRQDADDSEERSRGRRTRRDR